MRKPYGSRLSKDIMYKGNKLINFYERNVLENLNGKRGADINRESKFIKQAKKSAIDYEIVSDVSIINLAVRLQVAIYYV